MKRLLSIAIFLALAVCAPSASAQHDRYARKYLKQGIERFNKGDLAGASLLENWIDEGERRVWFLFETTRHGAKFGAATAIVG